MIRHPSRYLLPLLVLAAACTARPTPEATPPPPPATDASVDPIVAERQEILMLAALANTHAGLGTPVGYDISAVIAWDVEDTGRTPHFVIERNRNFEKQGDIFHAEINTLRAAYERTRDADLPPKASRKERTDL
jgi:hypothetical protein